MVKLSFNLMFNNEVMVPPVHPRDNDHNNDGDLLLEKVRHTIAFLLRRCSYTSPNVFWMAVSVIKWKSKDSQEVLYSSLQFSSLP